MGPSSSLLKRTVSIAITGVNHVELDITQGCGTSLAAEQLFIVVGHQALGTVVIHAHSHATARRDSRFGGLTLCANSQKKHPQP